MLSAPGFRLRFGVRLDGAEHRSAFKLHTFLRKPWNDCAEPLLERAAIINRNHNRNNSSRNHSRNRSILTMITTVTLVERVRKRAPSTSRDRALGPAFSDDEANLGLGDFELNLQEKQERRARCVGASVHIYIYMYTYNIQTDRQTDRFCMLFVFIFTCVSCRMSQDFDDSRRSHGLRLIWGRLRRRRRGSFGCQK